MDPKGDNDLLNRVYYACLKSIREDDFVFFALPYPGISVSYNPLQNFVLSNELSDRIAYLIPAGNNPTFKDFSWQVLLDVINGLLYLGMRPTLKLIHRYSLSDMELLGRKCIDKFLRDIGYGLEADELKKQEGVPFVEYYSAYQKYGGDKRRKEIDDLITRISHPKEHFQKMIASLSPLLKKLTAGEIGELLSTVPSGLDWERAVEKKKVVYMYFGSQLVPETSEAVMQMVLQDLTSFSGTRYAYKFADTPVNLFLDEFNDMVGINFIKLLNKGRGAGFRFFLGTQSLADLPSKLPKKEMADQIMDNIGNLYWMRTQPATAQYMTEMAGEVLIQKKSVGVNFAPDVSDKEIVYKSTYSQSYTEERVKLLEPTWLSRLPVGQGFVQVSGKLYCTRFPVMENPGIDYLEKIGIKKKAA
jgi:conjugal transfer pilus assembly protein TraD